MILLGFLLTVFDYLRYLRELHTLCLNFASAFLLSFNHLKLWILRCVSAKTDVYFVKYCLLHA